MVKSDELRSPRSCLNRSAPDEPLFVLCARDHTAPAAIRLWASMNHGIQPPDKLQNALDTADHMEKWRGQNVAGCEEAPPTSLGGFGLARPKGHAGEWINTDPDRRQR